MASPNSASTRGNMDFIIPELLDREGKFNQILVRDW